MSDFDDIRKKSRDLTYDPSKRKFTNDDNSVVFGSTISKDGKKLKYDFYESDGDFFKNGNSHKGTHINVDINGDWRSNTHNEDKSKKTSNSGSGGCYLTSACMEHYQSVFDDNCEELSILRWFRDSFVSKDDIDHYYRVAPLIVDAIDSSPDNDTVYSHIYNHIIKPCVDAIKNGDYSFAYQRYKDSVLSLEDEYITA